MLSSVLPILLRTQQLPHDNMGVSVVHVSDQKAGLALAQDVVTEISDKKTALFLSGGRTPKDLYTTLATDERLHVGVVGLVDERYGPKGHVNSNEQMIRDTGLTRVLALRNTPFYPILQDSVTRGDAAEKYDSELRSLFAVYQKSVAILGIGLDGHTAGIAGNRSGFINPMFDERHNSEYIFHFNDEKGMFKERITMTFLGLSMMDFLLVLAFGAEKKKALDQVFGKGLETDIPGRFITRKTIAHKTLLITDQHV